MPFKPLVDEKNINVPESKDEKVNENITEKETVTLQSAETELYNKLENIIQYLKNNHTKEFLGIDKLLAYSQIQGIIFKIESAEYQTRKSIEAQKQTGDKTRNV